MIIDDIVFESRQSSVEVELPRANMVIDPRPNYPLGQRLQCEYHDNGTTVTLTRPDNRTHFETFEFRVYDPATETVPSFDSTIYTDMGEDGEQAPHDTTILIIHPSVTVIKERAFYNREEIKKCFMHDGVHTIEEGAFHCCCVLKVIRLSRSLTNIGEDAFYGCSSLKDESLEAVFLPPSVNKIGKTAFGHCTNLRIFSLPLNIDISQIKGGILYGCDNFFETTQIQEYDYDYDNEDEMLEEEFDSNRVHQAIIHFYRNQVPPLHKACLDTNVTRQTIQQCIDTHGRATVSIIDHNGMTPLHILAMNPYADISAILACFDLDMSSLFVRDSIFSTPLDYLGEYHEGIEYLTPLISSLCVHRFATVSSQDDQDNSINANKKRKRANDE